LDANKYTTAIYTCFASQFVARAKRVTPYRPTAYAAILLRVTGDFFALKTIVPTLNKNYPLMALRGRFRVDIALSASG
jgi:hypothetical protein